jgi:predicted MFS family arabinose efflux permease
MQDIESLQRRSTRLAFLAAGMGMSAWAALVPFAKARMALGSAELGLLLLFLGMGSIVAMPSTGMLVARHGCRTVILSSGAISCLVLPFLAVTSSPPALALALFMFGAAIGTLDVSMNIHAVVVEKAQGGALMSGFHGLFSVGGFVGAGGMALILWTGLGSLAACMIMTACIGAVLFWSAPHFLRAPAATGKSRSRFALPHGAVVFIGLLCFIVFLAEGAMLDWSALLMTTGGLLTTNEGGLGYAVFAVAMTIARLTGDRMVRNWGRKRIMLFSGFCTAAGFITAALASSSVTALLGFLLIGAGAANIVPILFTAAGRQKDMPAGMALSAVTTLGYAGLLAGPAIIGFVAHASSLHLAFGGVGCAMLLVAAGSRSRLLLQTET